jgi:hypothetical protein
MFCSKCGKENPETGIFCWSCGNKLFKHEVRSQSEKIAPVLVDAPVNQIVMRDGNNLLVPRRNAILPLSCVKCGATGIPRPYKLAWMDPSYFVFFFFGILPYFILRLFLRKTIRLAVPLCEHHYNRARNLGIAATVILVASIPFGLIVDEVLRGDAGLMGGLFSSFFLIVAGLVVMWFRYPLQAIRIDKDSATLAGASENFLGLLGPIHRQ